MDELTHFHAAFYRISTDKDGESRVIFEVPLSEMPQVTKLLLAVGEPIKIIVERTERS